MSRAGCFSPAAMLLVAGTFLAVCGGVSDSPQALRAGLIFLALAVVAFLAALFVRWQGWGD